MVSRIERRWVLPAYIVLSLLVLFFAAGKLGSPVSAKAELQTEGSSEISAVPIQIERDKYGLAMVDTVNQTLWIYEINSTGPAHNRLRLIAARSWRYDRLLKQYNTAEPKPEQVRMLLEKELGKRFKENVKEKQEDSDVDMLETNQPKE